MSYLKHITECFGIIILLCTLFYLYQKYKLNRNIKIASLTFQNNLIKKHSLTQFQVEMLETISCFHMISFEDMVVAYGKVYSFDLLIIAINKSIKFNLSLNGYIDEYILKPQKIYSFFESNQVFH